MKTYSVKEIADMLKTNPETVRRWIRDKKLEATIESKKGGHIVYESALNAFLKSSPKYLSIANTAVYSTMMIGGLVAQKILDVEQLKKARISISDVVMFLESEISKIEKEIKIKENNICQLQEQLKSDKAHVEEYRLLINGLKNNDC